ncbi:hypothetical protein MSPP1_000818 [Malassezia sp. CBS 17886]|nr:hypothetical protein MSPP1_000818 [Malassezia sp. CBS 17886]
MRHDASRSSDESDADDIEEELHSRARTWAPLQVAGSLFHASQSTPARAPPAVLTPLSQLPLPYVAGDARSSVGPLPGASPSATFSAHAADLFNYNMDADLVPLADDASDGGGMDSALLEELTPIAPAPLRMHCGIPAVDQYVGYWRTGGAFASARQTDREEASMGGHSDGFAVGSALELVGPPGIGKTAWAMQMAILERLQHVVGAAQEALAGGAQTGGGTGDACDVYRTLCTFLDTEAEPYCAQVVVADTEGAFSPPRLQHMVQVLVAAAPLPSMGAAATPPPQGAGADARQMRDAFSRAVLRGIHIVRILSLGSLVAFLGRATASVHKFGGLPPRTSLLIVDSLSFFTNFHALPENATPAQRKGRMDSLVHILSALTTLRDSHRPVSERLTVLVTNEMATRMPGAVESRPAPYAPESHLVPAVMPPSYTCSRSRMPRIT